ncbi:MAG: hypothetical protein HFI13_11050 [Lachnospiraceae bacterium]|nr:hypothetical protein [Lachnospiraceae bacterium]
MKDIIIVYEHRSRELENACLLASELQFRGYKTSIENIYSLKKYFMKTKVIIVPHLYDDFQLITFTKNYWRNIRNIISLQYEQIFYKNRAEENDIHDPVDQAKYAQHTAWGTAQKERYLNHGIQEDHITVTGHMGMDLLKNEFEDYFFKKNELGKKFHIDSQKEWVLFISSFSYVTLIEEETDRVEILDPSARIFKDISEKSYYEILVWLQKAAVIYPEKIFIYRRHPAERYSKEILEIEKKVSNFRCIDQYSIRQWVRVCDKLYTWFSTSIADAYYANKMCCILRPYMIPQDLEIDLMDGADTITTYEQFLITLDGGFEKFPIKDEAIQYYYGNCQSTFAFIVIADLCESLILGTRAGYDYDYGFSRFDIRNSGNIRKIFVDYMRGILFEICKIANLSACIKDNSKLSRKIALFCREGYKVSHDIKIYINKFKPIIAAIHKGE